jgi:hypothetical protein
MNKFASLDQKLLAKAQKASTPYNSKTNSMTPILSSKIENASQSELLGEV